MSAGAKGPSIYSIVDNSDLLKRIHVLDSYKDAIEPTKSVAPKNYDILESALRKLYYGLDETFYPPAKWHERLNYIFSKEIPFTGIELDLVFVRNSLDQSKLDKTFYFNESGRGAKAVHDKKSGPLRVIDTAAQHVDEGPGKGNLPFPSDKMPLTSKEEKGKISFDKDFMKKFGFPTVNSWTAKTASILKLIVKYKYNVDLEIPKSIVNKQKKLKIGNPDKNNGINKFSKTEPDDEILRHVLCKELGDAMQTASYLVFYNYLKKNGNYNKTHIKDLANRVTMLTCDKTVHYRNVLLGLPSVLTTNEHEVNEKGKKKFEHSTKRGKMFVPSGDIKAANEIKHDILKRQIISNNEELIKLLQSLNNDLSLEMIIPPKNKYRAINTKFKEIEILKEEIEKINESVNREKYEELYKNKEKYLIPHFLFKSRKPLGFIFDPNMIKKLGEKNPKLLEIFTKYLNVVWDKNPKKIHKYFKDKEEFRAVFGITDRAGKKGGGSESSPVAIPKPKQTLRLINLGLYFDLFDSWVEKNEEKYFNLLKEQTVFPSLPIVSIQSSVEEDDLLKVDLNDIDTIEDYRLSVDELIIFYELEKIVYSISNLLPTYTDDDLLIIIFMLYKRIVYQYNLDVIDINHKREHRDKEEGAQSNELDNGFSKLIELIHSENKEKLIRDMELEIMKPVALTKKIPRMTPRMTPKTYRPRSPTTTTKIKTRLPTKVSFKSRKEISTLLRPKTRRKIIGHIDTSWTRRNKLSKITTLTKKNKSKRGN